MTRSQRGRRRLLVAVASAATLALAACSGQTASFSGGGGGGGDDDDGKSVSMAVVAGWDDSVASSYLWKSILEERGYTVRMQELDIASTFTGVANGQVDMYSDAWLPYTHEQYWSRFEDKLEVLSSWSSGSNLLAAPDYVDVNSIADLQSKGGEFGDRIVGIEAGGGLMTATRDKAMPQYGLDDFELVEGSSPAMLAALDTAIKAKKPIVVTLWEPHWAFVRWPLKVLEDPKGAYGDPDEIQMIATKGFGEDHPEIAGWMKNFKLEPKQLGEIMFKLQEKGQGNAQAAADEWISENRALVDSWLGSTG